MSTVHLDLKEDNMSHLFNGAYLFEQTAPAGQCSWVATFSTSFLKSSSYTGTLGLFGYITQVPHLNTPQAKAFIYTSH